MTVCLIVCLFVVFSNMMVCCYKSSLFGLFTLLPDRVTVGVPEGRLESGLLWGCEGALRTGVGLVELRGVGRR